MALARATPTGVDGAAGVAGVAGVNHRDHVGQGIELLIEPFAARPVYRL
jgi:hypothetical protein